MLLLSRLGFVSLVFLVSFQVNAYAQDANQQKLDYINRYQKIAVKKMKEQGIPASITLAQGILESNSGTSELALKANNHFGIKCTSDWEGMEFHKDDDKPNECFRKYEKAEESFEDHSRFLQRERYRFLYNLPATDYAAWARGLKKAGYATNPQYPDLLIKIIEDFKLYLFDQGEPWVLASVEKTRDSARQEKANLPRLNADKGWKKTQGGNPDQLILGKAEREINQINGVRYIFAGKHDNLENLTMEFDLFPWQLRKFNDLPKGADLQPGQVVYIEHKARTGEKAFHVMEKGESLWQISQKYGIRLKFLYRYNHLEKGLEPEPGSKILLIPQT